MATAAPCVCVCPAVQLGLCTSMEALRLQTNRLCSDIPAEILALDLSGTAFKCGPVPGGCAGFLRAMLEQTLQAHDPAPHTPPPLPINFYMLMN